jgi:hypothetical protein
MDFRKFEKIPRLRREIVITEKIDGTNAQIFIRQRAAGEDEYLYISDIPFMSITDKEIDYVMVAGSRNRYISADTDNYGFGRWVSDNRDKLLGLLGEGRHFGEWWGAGIQRRYDMGKKIFSLFNTKRWDTERFQDNPRIVPVLYEGPWSDEEVGKALLRLEKEGSVAAPGFMRPEGVVIYHKAANSLYKVTLEKDGGKWKI